MRPWTMPLTCVFIAGVIAVPVYRVAWILEEEEKARTEYYLSIRVENVPAGSISSHLLKIEDRFMGACAQPELQQATRDFPDGYLFFFNTSRKQWANLGGEAGYAIIRNGRIVWKLRLAKS